MSVFLIFMELMGVCVTLKSLNMINDQFPSTRSCPFIWGMFALPQDENKDLQKLAECKHGTVYKKNGNTSGRTQKNQKTKMSK